MQPIIITAIAAKAILVIMIGPIPVEALAPLRPVVILVKLSFLLYSHALFRPSSCHLATVCCVHRRSFRQNLFESTQRDIAHGRGGTTTLLQLQSKFRAGFPKNLSASAWKKIILNPTKYMTDSSARPLDR